MALSRITNPFLSSSGSGNASITSPSANTIAFSTTTAERMRIDSSGAVGIGITSPRNFEVSRSDSNTLYGQSGNQFQINIRNTDTTANNWAGLTFNQGPSSLQNPVAINAQFLSPTSASLVVFVSGSERMRIDSAGNLLVGRTSVSGLQSSNLSGNIQIPDNIGSGSLTIGGFGSFLGRQASDGSTWLNTGQAGILFSRGAYGTTTESMRIDSNGNIGVNNSNPTQYVSSGKVFNITGTANLSGPANLYMTGSTSYLGGGFYSTEVFNIIGLTAATEITRITGTGSNGWRAYFKITVTGHTSSLANGINIKEFYWDGGTNAPVQISTYTANSPHPITFDNTTNNVCIIKLASGNGTNEGRAVMKVEWMIPPDFNNSTWTIT